VLTACVRFDEKSISGLTLLDDSGIPYQAQDGFMNSILNLSNPQDSTLYWSYWHWNGREWVFNNTGAAESEVLPGSIEAWYFTSWERFPSLPPEYTPHSSVICGENIAKNYTVQPYLHYYDLHQPVQGANQAKPYIPEDQTPAIESLTQAETRPTTLIILIGILGVIVFALIIWLPIRKK
jgi:hypothetical protein